MERIEIKDFVGIKDISIEIKQINILIGPQASGKSIVAKLVYFFKNFIFRIIDAATLSKELIDLEEEFKIKFKEYFPSLSWGNKKFKIKYFLDREYIEIFSNQSSTKEDRKIQLKYSQVYKDYFISFKNFAEAHQPNLNQTSKLALRLPSISNYELKNAFSSIIAEELSQKAIFFQLYIPAGRSFYANLKKSIFHFISVNNSIESFLIDFGRYYEQIKDKIIISDAMGKNQHQNLYREIENLKERILCGKYMQKNGEDYLITSEDRQVELIKSSSGQQETLPLTITLEAIAYEQTEVGGNSIYIEEPEAHIFPAAQKNIVELVSTVYNARKNNLQFFITTHSPYILTSFNNLIEAGILAKDATEEKIEQISQYVSKSRFINPDEIAVYSLENGYCKSIIDKETGLIDANTIDEVSNELAVQFDLLLDIEE